ncbi:MAG: helix-turn-helix domain-containing protein [Patescibacteria group bacterium]
MHKFSTIQIKNKTVGEILFETRREQNLTLEEAAEETHIHTKQLAALEAGDYETLPGGVYSEKILETYANFLNLDLEGLKKLFEKENLAHRHTRKNTFLQKISPKHFLVTPRLIEISVAAIFIILLLTYLGFEINNIFSPPNLFLSAPENNLTTENPTITIVGYTEKEVNVKINDQTIQTDAVGNFNETISLKTGLNIIKVSAAKKRSRENIIYRQIILK